MSGLVIIPTSVTGYWFCSVKLVEEVGVVCGFKYFLMSGVFLVFALDAVVFFSLVLFLVISYCVGYCDGC